MMDVLIFDPELCQSAAIAKYLKKYSVGACITGCKSTEESNKLLQWLSNMVCYNQYIVHEIDRSLLDRYPIIIPTGGLSTLKFSDLLPEYRLGEIGFKKENLAVSDKHYMFGICNELNIPVPYTYRTGEKIETFPVFYKSDHETSVIKIRGIAKSSDELAKIPKQGVLVQEYISTPSTFGVGFIAQNGKLLTHFMHEELISYPKAGGSGVVLKKINDPKLLQYTSMLADKLQYHGWGLAEFKYCAHRNDYVFMEINAKFWASVEFALMCNPLFGKLLFGLDYPEKSYNYIVYLNRLLRSNPINWLRFLPQIITGYRTLPGGWRSLLEPFVRAVVKKRR